MSEGNNLDLGSVPYQELKREVLRREAEFDRLSQRRAEIDLQLSNLGVHPVSMNGRAKNGMRKPRSTGMTHSTRQILLQTPIGSTRSTQEFAASLPAFGYTGDNASGAVSVAMCAELKRGTFERVSPGVYRRI